MINKEHKENIVWLTEVNSGFIQHKEFKIVLKNLLEFCKNMLVDMGNIKFESLPKWSSENKFKINVYDLVHPHQALVIIPKNIKISFVSSPNSLGDSHIILSAQAGINKNQPEIDIFVDREKYPRDVLSHLDKLEETLSHELVHIVKALYNNKQKNASEYLDDSDNVIWDKYFSDKHELDAFITQINTEIKNAKKIDKNISLSSALLKSSAYRGISKEVKNKKVVKKLLGKVVHYWKHGLGGNINEYRKIK